jgi:hypothetical protein
MSEFKEKLRKIKLSRYNPEELYLLTLIKTLKQKKGILNDNIYYRMNDDGVFVCNSDNTEIIHIYEHKIWYNFYEKCNYDVNRFFDSINNIMMEFNLKIQHIVILDIYLRINY